MIEYNGIHGDFEWEIVGRTLRVFSSQRKIGLLKVFENVNAINSEQAQWSAQGKIDLNLDLLRQIQAAKTADPAQPAGLAGRPPNPTDSGA